MSDRVISQRTNAGLLLALTAVVAVTFSLLPRIPQPQSYHLFADRRGFLGILNFGDVVSNVPFGVIGICGLLFLLRSRPSQLKTSFLDSRERWPYQPGRVTARAWRYPNKCKRRWRNGVPKGHLKDIGHPLGCPSALCRCTTSNVCSVRAKLSAGGRCRCHGVRLRRS